MRTRHLLTLWLQLLAAALLFAGAQAARAEEDFLDPEVAFKLAARAVDERTVELTYTVAPGYYLYREQFKFVADGVTLGGPVLPAGKTKFDETFQKTVEIYRDVLRISVPVRQATSQFQLLATNQGCADKGLCYPPQQRGVDVRLIGFGGDGAVRVMAAGESLRGAVGAAGNFATAQTRAPFAADDPGIDGALRGGKIWPVVGVFFVAGLLLSFTPCVLPMLPILSSIIVGQGTQVSRGRGFALALSYSLGMALVYTALGVAAGLAGEGLAATLQNPWVLGLFAAGLVALSLSMFGVYELQLPSALAGRLSEASQRLPAGRFASVFAMGGVSALIVSPCVAAPLAGALVYLSQTRDVWLGGTALFCLAAGMSIPLLLVGASAGALLPRAGGWMTEVKRLFGLLLLGRALRQRVRDGRCLGADRQPVRGRAAGRRARLPEPDARRVARRHGSVLPRCGHEHSAAAGRRFRGRTAAPRGRLDDRSETSLRPAAARRGAVDRAVGAPGRLGARVMGRADDLLGRDAGVLPPAPGAPR